MSPNGFMGRRHYLITGAASLPVDAYVLLGMAVLAGAALYGLHLNRPSAIPRPNIQPQPQPRPRRPID